MSKTIRAFAQAPKVLCLLNITIQFPYFIVFTDKIHDRQSVIINQGMRLWSMSVTAQTAFYPQIFESTENDANIVILTMVAANSCKSCMRREQLILLL